MTKQDHGDDLDDGLDYQVDFSENEQQDDVSPVGLSSEDEFENDTEEKPTQSLKTEQQSAKKRKTTDSNFKEKKRMKMELDLQLKKLISTESCPEIIADFINKTVAQKNKRLSTLELTDLYISKNDIRSTSEIEGERTLEGLSNYINSRFKNMLPAKKTKKSGKIAANENKFIAILSMSAIRACDVFRCTKDLNGSSLKLINKNKINNDISVLKKSPARVLCCTPGRLQKVYNHEENVLKKEEIKIVILDNSYLDQKGQNIWDIPETINVLKDLTNSGAKIYLY